MKTTIKKEGLLPDAGLLMITSVLKSLYQETFEMEWSLEDVLYSMLNHDLFESDEERNQFLDALVSVRSYQGHLEKAHINLNVVLVREAKKSWEEANAEYIKNNIQKFYLITEELNTNISEYTDKEEIKAIVLEVYEQGQVFKNHEQIVNTVLEKYLSYSEEQNKKYKGAGSANPQKTEVLKSDVRRSGGSNLKISKDVDAENKASFKSEFKMYSVDTFRGIATGCVIPAGSRDRTYLDGDYMGDELVYEFMVDFMVNQQLMNLDHEASNLQPFYAHEDFAVIESWQARADFTLGGEQVKKGDWMMSIIARSDKFKQDLKDGLYNGFSVEGWIYYYPDEVLVHD